MVDLNIQNLDLHYLNTVIPIQWFHLLHTPEFCSLEYDERHTVYKDKNRSNFFSNKLLGYKAVYLTLAMDLHYLNQTLGKGSIIF